MWGLAALLALGTGAFLLWATLVSWTQGTSCTWPVEADTLVTIGLSLFGAALAGFAAYTVIARRLSMIALIALLCDIGLVVSYLMVASGHDHLCPGGLLPPPSGPPH